MSIFDEIFSDRFFSYVPSSYQSNVRIIDDGTKVEYLKNGRLHNENGPAVVYYKDSKEEYFLEGRQVSKERIDEYKTKKEDEKIHFISIDDQDYKITGKQLREFKEKNKEFLKIKGT
jgi:hypothetical protein